MKIWGFISGGYQGFYKVVALDENGDIPAGHISSNSTWAKHDIGVGSNWKHDLYDKKYGEGNWEIEWVENPEENFKLMEIINRLNQEEDAKGTGTNGRPADL